VKICWRAFWSRRAELSRNTPHTSSTRRFTGLLVKRDAKEVVLHGGSQNQEIVLAAKNVEELQPSRTSLPDGQLAGLTA
jgi:hypothetical protein